MGRQPPYSEEFLKDAVALYRASGGKCTYAAAAADVGIPGARIRPMRRPADDQHHLGGVSPG
ncbi:hypothetical protein BIV23_44095 [Streptomyces monashensis]|uniref:Transposase n=1 Tax=Streptomyces monashensis TaxID=1678012 RepID=A0A1S2NYH1_9ACTN|nr:hypothetical protein BIV23_44095 [Streptomyces monashensis]